MRLSQHLVKSFVKVSLDALMNGECGIEATHDASRLMSDGLGKIAHMGELARKRPAQHGGARSQKRCLVRGRGVQDEDGLRL